MTWLPRPARSLARLATGEATVPDLARPFEVSAPAISRHLRVLEAAGDRADHHDLLHGVPAPEKISVPHFPGTGDERESLRRSGAHARAITRG